MMTTLLVNPAYTQKVYGTKKPPSIQPPIGLAYLAASLKMTGKPIEILDANAEFLNAQQTAERIINSPAKYIGFTSVTTTIPLISQISSLIKKSKRDKIIIAGGPHVTFMPEQTLKDCPAIDIIIKGEGELILNELINILDKNQDISKLTNIKGISFRQDNKIINNPARELIPDINSIDFPARELLPVDLYSPSPLSSVGFKGRQYARIITTRGCPNRCVFCSSSYFWKKVRVRSAENVVDEIELIVKKFGVKHIDFLDDSLTLSIKRLEEICNLIIQKKFNIKWSCYSRVNTITPKLVALMKKSGCKVIQFGVESGSQNILNRIKKGITLEQISRACKMVKQANIKLMCDFMIGLPDDTQKTVNETIDFAIQLEPQIAFFSITTPFPGTDLYKEYRQEGLLKPGYIWQNMNLHERTNFFTPTLSSQDLEKLYFKAQSRFYYRPAYFLQTLKWICKNPYEVKNYYSLAKILILRQLKNLTKK